MPLLLIFILVPIIEIGLFIQVGGWLGLWPTLAIVVLTALAGTMLLRAQGLAVLGRLQQSMAEGGNPVDPMVHGALILMAGMLLLTPGFFTDAVGFAFLIPPLRQMIINWGAGRFIGKNTVVFGSQMGERPRPSADTVDADYVVLDDEEDQGDRPRGNSGWTRPEE